MWNKLYIIIDRKSTKPQLIWKFSLKDIVYMCIAFLVGYVPFKIAGDEFAGMLFGTGLFCIMGFLLIDLPDHLSVIEHLKMWYDYEYRKPKEYFYIPESEILKKEEEQDQESMEWFEYQEMIKENKRLN